MDISLILGGEPTGPWGTSPWHTLCNHKRFDVFLNIIILKILLLLLLIDFSLVETHGGCSWQTGWVTWPHGPFGRSGRVAVACVSDHGVNDTE